MSSTEKGRMSELVAMTAFMANGYTVMEPICAETWDFVAYNKEENTHVRIQVKTCTKRTRDGVDYFVIKGRRNTGNPYTYAETDLFAGVYEGKVYVTENRELSEYWCKVDEAHTRWLRLEPLIS